MKKITLLFSFLMIFGITLNAQTYSEDFETLTKTSYASETVTLNGYDWNFTGSNAGNATNDWKIGAKSARLAGTTKETSNPDVSKIEMLSNKTGGIGNITFQYRQYGTDAQIPWKIEWSADGTSWTNLGEITATDQVQTFSMDLNKASARIRIIANGFETSSSNGKRINIDNLVLTDNGGAAEPVLSVTPQELDFGNATVGSTTAALQVTVNAGNFSATPTYSIIGANNTEFAATGSLTTAGGTIDITFAPSSDGAKTATLEVKGEGITETVVLNGNGTDASNPYGLDDRNPINSINEPFGDGTVTDPSLPNGWTSISEQGDRNWEVKRYNENNYAQMTAHNGTGVYQTLLISPAINFDAIDKTNVTFDWNSGYSNGATLKVYVMSKDGTKTEVKTINDNVNTGGYGASFTTETLDLSAFSGTKFLVFEYNGEAGATTTTYQVDNVVIQITSSIGDISSAIKIYAANGNIYVDNDGTITKLAVYNIAGQKLAERAAVNGLNAIAVTGKGIYVVKLDNHAVKVLVK